MCLKQTFTPVLLECDVGRRIIMQSANKLFQRDVLHATLHLTFRFLFPRQGTP